MKTCSQCQVKYPDVLEFCPRDGSPLPPTPGGSAAHHDPLLNTTIDGRYAIEARLGEGGMGVVYRARHVLIDKPVAIKILRKEAAQDQASVKRFIQEAKSASKIGHSNIVDITDFGVLADGHAYFVMEFLQGPTLAQTLQEGPLDPARVCVIAAQMARGLHAAHQQGIVHRDLKPENIFLLEREGQKDFVKVVDFGIAKVGGGQRLTQVGMVLGTPEYMSPEQATGQETDHRVDQYALGCMMYEMLTGVVPFLGERPAQTLTKHVFEPVIPPRQRKPDLGIPQALEAVVMRTLAKKAGDRFPSMRDLEMALIQVESELRSGRVVVDDSQLYRARQLQAALSQEQTIPSSAPTQAIPQQSLTPLQPAFSGPSQTSTPSPASGAAAVPYPTPTQLTSQPVLQAVTYAPSGPVVQPPYVSGSVPVAGSVVYPPNSAPYSSNPSLPTSAPGLHYARSEGRPTRETRPTQRARKLRSVVAAVGGALVVIAALVVYLLLSEQPPQRPAPHLPETRQSPQAAPPDRPPPDKPPPPDQPPQPKPPERVEIVVRSTPRNATVYVDGASLGLTPVTVSRPRGSQFVLELRKGGYQPYVRDVTADSGQEMPISMTKKGDGKGRKKSKAEGPAPVQQPPPTQAPPPSGPPPGRDGLRNPFGPRGR